MAVEDGIEIEGGGLKCDQEDIHPGEGEPGHQVDGDGAVDGLGIDLARAEDAMKDNHEDKHVEGGAEDKAGQLQLARGCLREDAAMERDRDGEDEGDDPGETAGADGVDAGDGNQEAEQAKPVVTYAGVALVGIQDEISEQKHEEQQELSLHPGRQVWAGEGFFVAHGRVPVRITPAH